MVHTHSQRSDLEVYMPPTPRKTTKRGTVKAKGLTVTPLDQEGQPVPGGAVTLPDAEVTLGVLPPVSELEFTPDDSGIELEFAHAFDAAGRETLQELARIPIPTAVIERWFPAFVRWPGEDGPLHGCKVLLTPQGLYVYKRKPAAPEAFTTGATPDRYAPVLFEETARPAVGTVARNAGIRIATPIGPVIVQPTGGCGCGSSLKRWTPEWARNVISWDAALQLAGQEGK